MLVKTSVFEIREPGLLVKTTIFVSRDAGVLVKTNIFAIMEAVETRSRPPLPKPLFSFTTSLKKYSECLK